MVFGPLKFNIMDIDLLSKMVKELILDNDRVVLPGLGAFVAEIVPSTFSDKGYTINPPYRRLFFRAKPNEGSELARLYAQGNNVELAVAERIVADFVAELRTILHTRKTVVFPGLGRLRATKENNVFFVADEDLDIYPAGFGLEPISLKTHQETREEVAAAVEDLKSLLEPEVIPELEQTPEPTPEPEVTPEPEIQPEPEVIPEPEPEPESDPEPEPKPESQPAPVPDTLPEAAPQETQPQEPTSGKKPNARKTLLIIAVVILAIFLILLAALAILGRTNPELVDRFLYNPDELKILNHIL